MDNTNEGYIKTTTHNFVSRQAKIQGAKQVELKGRSILQKDVTVRGDLAVIRIGRYCEIDEGTVIEPPVHPMTKKHVHVVIGSHSRIGKACTVRAAAIGSMVWIGDNVTMGERCIIKDNCYIESGTVLGRDTVVPPFTRISKANPHRTQELPPSVAVQLQEMSMDRFQEFREDQKRQLLEGTTVQ
mmetsp:Transcript_10108/g.27712  ORF Transcript_10108/g.27712 Transcript_10108/m.27712 type:complete len:185 (-) Transcript_10108:371-925(-)|eukprot:CAMPEP_0198124854 /NCGR_PEP_ID=MMETSP1442-20131203/41072_1 /TAXON_ID= /ORGANISM="Craspedostauros australis, Strain CCMP3328" /LENGTH=184 /DNA_ID=CAMNT_0043784343 /DNA_START=147 /DNA_END=701 /DNA_ORIENTATION=+